MAEVKQNLVDAQKVEESPYGGGETSIKKALKTGANLEARTVTIDASQVEEVLPEVGDHMIDIDRTKLRPVEGRAPTPIPSEEEWSVMRKEIQQLAAGGGERQEDEQETPKQISLAFVVTVPEVESEPSDNKKDDEDSFKIGL
ncbi:uncharacterized protein LOC111263473 [Varroa jacobsoni]|uniref:Uncharacterized protein n=1 Tax=Varroa destructor TaxID=109461 RepID=A0A7M7IY80_VARDE|nr:uncharacterized protein LOC111243252 [Varroa destructor]XP_022694307.1 uncharacterized protein LOC111263473 [Varroa jacobsoni]